MATTTKITLDGSDLVGADPSKPLNISKPLTYYSTFDGAVLGAINAFEGNHLKPAVVADKANGIAAEAAIPGDWLPKTKGADAYDPSLTTLQTINLYTAAGSSLIIKNQNKDAQNSSNSYDFISAGGGIHLSTNATISNAAPVVPVKKTSTGTTKTTTTPTDVKTDYDNRTNTIIYTNLGEVGTADDIKASLTQISYSIFTTKKDVLTAKVNYKQSLSYYKGAEYKVDISTQKEVLSDSPALAFSPTKNSVVIDKYAYLSNDFSISLSGNIMGAWGTDGNTEIMTLKNVSVQTPDYNLQTANLIAKNVYNNTDYIDKSGLTNLDSYNLIAVGDMQSHIIDYDLPKILTGDNIVTLKQAVTFDAGAGNDNVTGSADADVVTGGSGNDSITGMAGDDAITGDSGRDILSGGGGNDTLNGGDGNDNITGGVGDDALTGDAGSDTLTGGEGNDILNGSDGNDNINGGIGNDSLTSDAGSDKLTGGGGADTFSFQTSDFFTTNANGDLVFNKSIDTIADFKPKEGDTLSFGDMGEVAFFQSLSSAKSENAALFYLKGKIYYDTNPADDIYRPTVIVKLTGNPKVSPDFTGWETA